MQYGILNPESGLGDKVVPIHFAEKLDVRDPHTLRIDKKDLKPFMVNNSVLVFERNKVVLDPNDKNLIEQLHAYRVERISQKGMPIYTSENEHSLDCLNMCLLTFERKYGSLFKNILSSRVLGIKQIGHQKQEEVLSRDEYANMQSQHFPSPTSLVSKIKSVNSSKRSIARKKSFVGRTRF